MIIAIIRGNKIVKTFLPEELTGDYVLNDNYGEVIGNIVPINGTWVFQTNAHYEIISSTENKNNFQISNYTKCAVKNMITGVTTIIYAYPSITDEKTEVRIKKAKMIIGSSNECDIIYQSNYVKPNHAQLTCENTHWYIETQELGVFVNGQLIKRKRLSHGDIIFIYGLKLICISDFLVIINLDRQNALNINPEAFEKREEIKQTINEKSFLLEGDKEVYEENEYFLRSPRFKTSVHLVDVAITTPPESQKETTQPAILIIGPQLTMMLSSFINLFTTLQNVASGNGTLAQAMPSLLLTIVMLISSFLWPTLTRKYNKYVTKKKELRRVKVYRAYLKNKDKEIGNIIAEQKQILLENNVTLEQCQQIIYQKKRNLWEKNLEDEDYLTVRVGTGYIPPKINIAYEEEDFEIEDDFLKEELKDLIKKYDYVEEAPLNFSFIENRVTAVIGNYGILQRFMESILLQIMTFHIYNELKIFIFTDPKKVNDWDYLKFLPHCWDNQRETRYIAATIDEKKKLSSTLENIIAEREGTDEEEKDKKSEDATAYKEFNTYYLIITDSINSCRNLEGIKKVLEMKGNLGFSLLIKNDRIANLPSQCSTFINITEETSGIFKNELEESNQQQFVADLNKTVNVEDCVQRLANIPVAISREKYELPKSIGFLEMYNVGNVEQFNSTERWKNNNPVVSLAVPVGIDQNGELFNMDIHEKAYGPHGLVAGTTGSGKSEWIITYILSLAVNFDPNEVQFVLIDYKGGGLAGSFVNEETGMRLPHLVGTITNLDKSEIRRSLASIESESKRRQILFNKAREKLNDSSMNIYKYQQYYRKGLLDEPLSHLLIISDEFAELKSQEPEFLNQLVSIARIGRSLGIHLILATQKPSGVVDEQMWSNSRFKVCLRVQDKSDSQDMLKCDDAAYLKQTGAFYLQVGMNEFFGLGQSAYAGAKYKPTNIVKKKIETSLDVIGQTGDIINTVDYLNKQESTGQEAHGEELLNIIMYLSNIAKKQNINCRRLWLDAIPEIIFADNLKQKYQFARTPFLINPIVGEYDDPASQKQALMTINLNKSNVFITGVSGSGKEKLLQTMIYSIIANYTPQEVNMYLCDFGAETLAMFENAPQVGDVVYQNDKDKIENLFRYIRREYKERRKRYRDFGGSFASFTKYSEKKDHVIVVVINSYETLKENYFELVDSLTNLFLESVKYGIVFVLTSVDANILRNKENTAFERKIALKMLNEQDYISMFGSAAKGILPKEANGRGLMMENNLVYEFQTASIVEESKMQQVVRNICEQLKTGYNIQAKPIPMIPKTINMNAISLEKLSINSLCVGYGKATIEPYFIDMDKNFGTLFIANKKAILTDYCKVLYRELDVIAENNKIYLFDNDNIFKPERYKKLTYVENAEVINTIKNLIIYVNGEYEKYTNLENKADYTAPGKSVIVFHNISALLKLLGYDLVSKLDEAIEHAHELGLFVFLMADLLNDYKEMYREKILQRLTLDSNGVLIGNTIDTQMFIDVTSKDIKQKDALDDHLGYIVEKGKAYMTQMLQFEAVNEEEDDL